MPLDAPWAFMARMESLQALNILQLAQSLQARQPSDT